MDDTKKTDAPGGNMRGTGASQGSGSDTVSAAKLAAGGAAGGTGQSPGSTTGAGSSAQSATLASHTSRPMGGTPQGRGTSTGGAQRSGSGDGGGMAEQVQNRAGEAYEGASEWARDTYEGASEWASDQYDRGARQLRDVRRSLPDAGGLQRFIVENPVLVGVVGLAAGLLLGALLPRTRQEDRMIGRWSDEVRDQGMRYARDMTQRGREYVDEALGGDEDDRFASPDMDRGRGERSGPSGRFQNH